MLVCPLCTLFHILIHSTGTQIFVTFSNKKHCLTMPSARSKSSSANDEKVNTKTITRSTTCKDLFTHADLEFVCHNCQPLIDILTLSRSNKRNKQKHRTNQCYQAWNESYATNTTRALYHLKLCKKLNLATKVSLDGEFKYKVNKIDSTHCIEMKSKSDPSVQTSDNSKEKVSSFESIGSSKHHTHKDKYSNANAYSKEKIFASVMDPLMLSSMNCLSTLTPTESHNCVTLHKQSVALNSYDYPMDHAHINKKQ